VVKRGEKTPRFSASKKMPRFENFSMESAWWVEKNYLETRFLAGVLRVD
jgi:hypothetical protein